MGDKNQYGRKTWDVEEYSKISKQRRINRYNNKNNDTNNEILIKNFLNKENKILSNNLNKVESDLFGEENNWLVCHLCNRRFKDSLKLSEHLSSKMHLNNVKKLEQLKKESLNEVDDNENESENDDITLEKVKQHLYNLKMLKDK